MATADEVLIRVRVGGGKAAAREVRGVEASVTSLGKSTSRTGTIMGGALGQVRRTTAGLGSDLRRAAGGVAKFVAAAGALTSTGMAVEAARTGAAYNEMQDRQEVAFATMLRSESKAAVLMKDIQALALDSPVLDPGTTGEAVQRLLNAGLDIAKVLPLVKTLGDASAASGKAITEVMPQAALALGQVVSRGALQAEELNQLTDSVGVNRRALAKELGYTSAEFAKVMQSGQISAEQALPAIERTLQLTSKGAARRLSKKTEGQVGQLREVLAKQLGQLTRPWYDAAGRTAGGVAKILQRKDLSTDQRVRLSFDVAKKEFGPLIRNARKAFKDAGVGQWIADGVEEQTPKIITAVANALASAAPRAAEAFVRGFVSMGPWGQLLTVAFLWRRLRLPFLSVGQRAGTALVDSIGASASKRMPGLGRRLGRLMGPAFAIAAGVLIANKLDSVIQGNIDAQYAAETDPRVRKLRGQANDARKRAGGRRGLKSAYDRWKADNPDLEREMRAEQRRNGGALSDKMARKLLASQMPGFVWNGKRAGAKYLRARATGGTTGRDEQTLVGERGPELAVFPKGTRINPAQHPATKRAVRERQGRAAPLGGRTVVVHTQVRLDKRVLLDAVKEANEVVELAR
jgi:tape measure domain-containing protein